MKRNIALGVILSLAFTTITANAQTVQDQREKKEFPMPDYSNWPVEKTETVVHPKNPNLSAEIILRKQPGVTRWLILTTLTGVGTEQNFISKRAFYLFFASYRSKNTLVLSALYPHTDNKWYVSEKHHSELQVGPKDFPRVALGIFDDLVSSFKETDVSVPAKQAGF